jgi:hypothetical protein
MHGKLLNNENTMKRKLHPFALFLLYFRFHKFSFSSNDFNDNGLNAISNMSIVDRSKMHAKLEIGKREDVTEMRQELGRARENLAEVKAIQLFISQQKPAITSMFLSCIKKSIFDVKS